MQLKQYLFENMLTQEEFAEKLGCTRNYISMICRGACYPSRRMAKKISELTRKLVVFNDFAMSSKKIGRPKKVCPPDLQNMTCVCQNSDDIETCVDM